MIKWMALAVLALLLLIFIFQPHKEDATPFLQESVKLYDQGNYLDSYDLAERALGNIRRKDSLSLKAAVYRQAATVELEFGNFKKADALLGWIGKKLQNAGPKYEVLYARCKSLQAFSFIQQARYSEADSLLKIAASIQENSIGKIHPDYALTTHWMGLSKFEQRKRPEALPFYLQAKDIRAEAPGTASLDYAISLDRLAEYYAEGEQDSLALAYCEEALRIVEDHSYKNRLLNTLGRVYELQGDDIKAIDLFSESQALQEKLKITSHPHYVLTLSNYASAVGRLGREEEAIALLRQSVTFYEKHGRNHPNYAVALNNLAELLENEDSTLEEAGLMYDGAAELFLKYHQPDRYLIACSNAATILRGTENHDIALSNYQQVVQSDEFANLRKYDQAYIYKNYAEALWWKVDPSTFGMGDSIIRVGEETFLQTYSPDFLNYLDFAGARAEIAELKHDTLLSASFYERNCQQLTTMLAENYPMMSEEERLFFYDEYLSYFPAFAKSFAVRHPDSFPSLYRKLLELQAAVKGASLQISLDQRLNQSYSSDQAYNRMLNEYFAVRRQLAKTLLYANPNDNDNGIFLDSLKALANNLEAQLSRYSQRLKPGLRQDEEQPTFESLRQSLTVNEVLVDFMTVDYFDPNSQRWGDNLICALVLKKEDNSPKFIPLCTVEKITNLISQNDGYINEPAQSHEIYETIWQPLEPSLDNAKRVYLCPEGVLQLLPFHALSLDTKGEQLLIDKYDIRYRLSPSDILRAAPAPTKKSVALMGGVLYDSLPPLPTNRPIASRKGGESFAYLPFSKDEVLEISNLFQQKKWRVNLTMGEEASEEYFRSLTRYWKPGIIHLATHGMFWEKSKPLKNGPWTLGERIKMADEPLLRSFLVFAGTNVFWNSKDTTMVEYDGILNAFEVGNMDLSSTDLVVLSACETAKGELIKQEGIFGLQRAFRLAGVRSLLVSLWAVPDEQTKELMVAFYKYYLNDEPAAVALRKAQLDMAKNNKPYNWAAFVLIE
jgi:CHAT domain-containing protein